jgi:hypothetical protein
MATRHSTRILALDLPFTAGQSYNDVLNGWNGYTTSQGYRFATRSEILTLFDHIGFKQSDAMASLQAANSALLLLGTTLSIPSSNLRRGIMNYDPSGELLGPMHVPAAGFGLGEAIRGGTIEVEGSFQVPGLIPTRDYRSPEIASALVRAVPEPATWFLFVVGFGAWLWRRQAP